MGAALFVCWVDANDMSILVIFRALDLILDCKFYLQGIGAPIFMVFQTSSLSSSSTTFDGVMSVLSLKHTGQIVVFVNISRNSHSPLYTME